MNSSRQKITLKVFVSYLILALLVVWVGWVVYGEINSFTKAQQDDSLERSKIFSIGKLLTLMYESESFARAAIQSNKQIPFEQYLQKNDSIAMELDSLQMKITNDYQSSLLDSVRELVDQKIRNIKDLRTIRHNNNADRSIQTAIEKFSNIEERLGRLSITDFSENPDQLSPRVRENLSEAIGIWNKYIPRDSSNTVDEKVLDSMVIATRTMLENIRKENSRQRLSMAIKENQLLRNDLNTSQQLRQILTAFENEFIENSIEANAKREAVLKRSINVITIAAIAAAVLMILFSIMILNDFFRSQRYREELEKSNELTRSLLKSREQLISMVSHDLRTPLSTIVGYTELLRKSLLGSRQAYYTDRVSKAASFITQLVDDLLDFSKLESGKIFVDKIPFHLENLISETAESVRSLYKDKPIRLEVRTDPQIDRPVVSDPFRLKQVLSNLIGNAYKFTEEGKITIEAVITRKEGKEAMIAISISDTGIGISEEKQQLIFEEFTQAENSIERKYGGSGLGLTISKKLVRLLGGELYLKSEKDKGSTFTFTIPARLSDKSQEIEPAEALKSMPALTGVLIDDDETLLSLLREILEAEGMTTHTFKDANKALLELKELEYDFIITDIQLPSMNGFHFAELLRADDYTGYSGQPIIAVTGRKELPAKDYLDAGFSGFLNKPYTPAAILSMIDQVMSGKTQFTENGTGKGSQKQLKPFNGDEAYNLSSMMSFLNNDESALKEILDLFRENTLKDLTLLEESARKGEYERARELGHKMQTMYRQINAVNIIPILNKIEHLDPEDTDHLHAYVQELKREIEIIFTQLAEVG
ncbi:ATP-binding protein [Robertkochia aurantiaca]|uniref:ATP-binding protein n=1 Tax=Robertkochia aurantiaca TaxID=2873700 RepID=UPI001CC8FBB6|nr:ATP-binding protein [Robertkochia sp. 3YJGBD-33]